MCQKEITREQAIQLVTEGKTDLIEGSPRRKAGPSMPFSLRQGAEDQIGNFRRANLVKARQEQWQKRAAQSKAAARSREGGKAKRKQSASTAIFTKRTMPSSSRNPRRMVRRASFSN